MDLNHYVSLYPAYFVAITLGVFVHTHLGGFFPYSVKNEIISYEFKKPWLEIFLVLAAGILTIFLGQLYIAGYMLPKGDFYPLTESINQILIFSPFFLLLLIRKQPLFTAYIPRNGKLQSLVVGVSLAVSGLLIVLLIKDVEDVLGAMYKIYHFKNLPHLVQVCLEDFAIAMVLFRLIKWVGAARAIIIVAILFAASHVPALITNGFEVNNLIGLFLDAVLGAMVIGAIHRTKSFLWFWMIHYAMDMTQFIN